MAAIDYPVLTLSGHARDLLHTCTVGTVHSVYKKTINLDFGGQLLALQAAGSMLSPISLVTELDELSMERLHIAAGDPVMVQSTALTINKDTSFTWDKASVHDLALTDCLPADQFSLLHSRIYDALRLRTLRNSRRCNSGSFELLFTDPASAEDILFLKVAGKRLSDTEQLLRTRQWDAAADELRRLTGLGSGLTPGGDDFLCGVLAGLIFCGLEDHPFSQVLSAQIREHLCDTNDISAAFLRCALHGQFSLAVKQLPILDSSEDILRVFVQIGHSSGTDTLCGVCYVLLLYELFAGSAA